MLTGSRVSQDDSVRVRILRLPTVEKSFAFQLFLVLDFVWQHARLLVAALVKHLDGHRAVLELVRGPHVKADVNASSSERCDVWNENEDIADELSVGAPRDRVEDASDCYDQVDACRVLCLQDSFHAFENKYVLAHAHRRRDQPVQPGVRERAAYTEGKYQSNDEPEEVDMNLADFNLDVEIERDKSRGNDRAQRVDNDQVNVLDLQRVSQPNVIGHHHGEQKVEAKFRQLLILLEARLVAENEGR